MACEMLEFRWRFRWKYWPRFSYY